MPPRHAEASADAAIRAGSISGGSQGFSTPTKAVGEGEASVFAAIGDELIIRSPRLEGRVRDGEILEVRGRNGSPPYVVRWSDNGHESLIFPGSDAMIRHFEDDENR